jgi:hypothetical protein
LSPRSPPVVSYAVFAAAPFVAGSSGVTQRRGCYWLPVACRLRRHHHLTPMKVGYFAAVALAIISILRQ